jgi:hypothetical protein
MRRFEPNENVNVVNIGFNADYLCSDFGGYLRDEFFSSVAYLASENGAAVLPESPRRYGKVLDECGGLGQIKIDYCVYGEDGKPVPPIPSPAWKWIECEVCNGSGGL